MSLANKFLESATGGEKLTFHLEEVDGSGFVGTGPSRQRSDPAGEIVERRRKGAERTVVDGHERSPFCR
jgi:hypothetical protein